MYSLSPFKILLNNLSNELDQRNLQSLKYVCGSFIPGGQRENITTGWDVFLILSQQNAIGEEPEKMKFLLRIIRELRPKRKDLVRLVECHIREHCEQPETILSDIESSWDGRLIPRPGTPLLVDVDDCCTGCSVRCCCCNCNCNPCCDGCCCCVILAILFSFFAVVAALLLYVYKFPMSETFQNDPKLSFVRPFVISVLGLIASCCLGCGFYLCIKQKRKKQAYSAFSVVDSMSNGAIHGSQYAASDSMRASYSGYPRNIRNYSCSSGQITASSSLASVYTPTSQRRGPDLDIVTDGCSQHHAFTQRSEADQKKEDDGSTEGRRIFDPV